MKIIVYGILIVMALAVAGGLIFAHRIGMVGFSFKQPFIETVSAAPESPARPIAFANVTVVPMDSERTLPNQTVIVRRGLIETAGNSDAVPLPPDTLVIDGAGKFLMPGLVDMHVHIKEENELLLFAAHGVTTIREMWGITGPQLWLGYPNQLDMRARINRGELFGPTIYTAGPIMEGPPPTSPLMTVFSTPEEAAQSVAWQAEQGYDFVKVYDNLTPETYRAILVAAREYGLPVVGHAPKQVGLEAVLAGEQQSIEHLTGYIDPDAADFVIPAGELDRYAAMTRESGTWVCPTIGVYQKVAPDRLAELERQPGMEYISPRMKRTWRFMAVQEGRGQTYRGNDYPERIAEIYTQMTAALRRAGAGIIAGTDSDNPYLVPGLSMHDELGYLVGAGLSPFEALQAATRNAAEALGVADEVGVIAEGKRADLLLLEANPLQDVANANRRAGVMIRGAWFTEAQLRGMLDGLAAGYRPTAAEKVWPIGLLALAGAVIGGGIFLRRRSARR